MASDPHEYQPQTWNALVSSLPGAHILQTWEWGQVKSHFGWQPMQRTWLDDQGRVVAAALILQRSLPIGGFADRLRILYVPKGPLCDWSDTSLRRRVLQDLAELARKEGAIFIKIDPDVCLGTGLPGQPEMSETASGQAMITDLKACGWHFSDEQIQFHNTVLLDLEQDLDVLLSSMKQKTRYNIRLAERKGVIVQPADETELENLFRMYAETSTRDGFVIRDAGYYREVWSTFMRAGLAEPLVASADGEVLAGVVIFRFAGKAWYLYGMSRQAQREKMPNYLLQWEAMKRAKASGCKVYDLWGAPDEMNEADPLWRVYRFKEGLGGKVVRYLGAWDLPVRPLYYRLYSQTLPRLLDVMRRRGKERTRKIIG